MSAAILPLPVQFQRHAPEVIEELHVFAKAELTREAAALRHEAYARWARKAMRAARARSGLSPRHFAQAIGAHGGLVLENLEDTGCRRPVDVSYFVQALALAGLDLQAFIDAWLGEPTD